MLALSTIREDRTGIVRCVTDGNHVVECLVEELVQRLAGLSRRINTDLVQHGKGMGADQRRLGTGTLYLEDAAAT